MNTVFRLPQTPMNISTAVSCIFRLWWENLSTVLVFSLIYGLINMAALHFSLKLDGFNAAYISILLLTGLVSLIPSAAVFAKLIHAAHNQPINSSQALAVSLTKFPKLLLLTLIISIFFGVPWEGFLKLYAVFSPRLSEMPAFLLIAIMGLFLVYFIILIIMVIYCILAFPIIISEDKSVFAALKKSFLLVRGAWWYTSTVWSVPIFAAFAGQLIITALAGKYAIVISQAIFMPLNMAVSVILYEHHKLCYEKK